MEKISDPDPKPVTYFLLDKIDLRVNFYAIILGSVWLLIYSRVQYGGDGVGGAWGRGRGWVGGG